MAIHASCRGVSERCASIIDRGEKCCVLRYMYTCIPTTTGTVRYDSSPTPGVNGELQLSSNLVAGPGFFFPVKLIGVGGVQDKNVTLLLLYICALAGDFDETRQ